MIVWNRSNRMMKPRRRDENYICADINANKNVAWPQCALLTEPCVLLCYIVIPSHETIAVGIHLQSPTGNSQVPLNPRTSAPHTHAHLHRAHTHTCAHLNHTHTHTHILTRHMHIYIVQHVRDLS